MFRAARIHKTFAFDVKGSQCSGKVFRILWHLKVKGSQMHRPLMVKGNLADFYRTVRTGKGSWLARLGKGFTMPLTFSGEGKGLQLHSLAFGFTITRVFHQCNVLFR